MNTGSRETADSMPLVFLALGSSLILGALIGAAYCGAQAWRIEADTIAWAVAGLAFLLVTAAVAPMMIGLGYGNAGMRRLLRFYTSPIRVVHMRRNRPIVLSGSVRDDDEDSSRAA
jgi:hypothetical protein